MKKSALLFCCVFVFITTAFTQVSSNNNLASIRFASESNRLNDEAKETLTTIADKMRKDTSLKLVVTGYCTGSKEIIQRSWDRVNMILNNYLINREGVAPGRFIFKYAQKGSDCNIVTLRAAAKGENGPSWVDAPYPDLRGS